MWANNTQQVQSRQFPAAPSDTYAALLKVAKNGFKLKTEDSYSLSLTFASGASAFTWGESFSAQVLTAGDGSTLNISGVGKVGGQLQQSSRTNKLIDGIFKRVSDVLQDELAALRAALEVEKRQADK